MNEIFTHTICENGDSDIPSWMFYSLCALPYVLLALDARGGRP